MNLKHTTLYWYLKRKMRKSNIRQGGYSQYGQDVFVSDILRTAKAGTFLDIGANDGVTFPNSLYFEELGWEGICVEPHPVIFKELESKRKCNLVNACISDQDELVDFVVVDGPSHMLSGIKQFMDEHHQERIDHDIKQSGGSKQTIKIEALSPTTLLKRFSINRIDFLSIDTEGCELPILQNFNFSEIPVKCISVENGSRSSDIFKYLTSVGFELAACVGCDEVYLHRSYGR